MTMARDAGMQRARLEPTCIGARPALRGMSRMAFAAVLAVVLASCKTADARGRICLVTDRLGRAPGLAAVGAAGVAVGAATW